MVPAPGAVVHLDGGPGHHLLPSRQLLLIPAPWVLLFPLQYCVAGANNTRTHLAQLVYLNSKEG